jgi:hypothetical protein
VPFVIAISGHCGTADTEQPKIDRVLSICYSTDSGMALRILHSWTLGAVLLAMLSSGASDALGSTKTKGKVRPPPDLKIISIETAPRPYVPSSTPLTLTIMVELPKSVPEDAILDVTTLISSVSRSSFRLLTTRQAVVSNHNNGNDLDPQASRRVEVVQNWDGIDHNARVISEGFYNYLVQAKLMVPNKSGAPLTRLNAWKKRGNFEVKTTPSARAE